MGNEHRRRNLGHESNTSQASTTQSTQHNRNGDRNDHQLKKPIRKMGFKMIEQLLDNDDVEDISFQLSNDKRGFKELLEDRDIKPDFIVLVIKLLGKVCSSSFQNVIINIFETVLRSSFIDSIVNYISKLIIQVST